VSKRYYIVIFCKLRPRILNSISSIRYMDLHGTVSLSVSVWHAYHMNLIPPISDAMVLSLGNFFLS
jgi:hypothetical protein